MQELELKKLKFDNVNNRLYENGVTYRLFETNFTCTIETSSL